MRIQRITTNYPAYLKQFYARQPELNSQPFFAQHAALMADASGWADFWSVALGKLGYEMREVVANAEPMQKAWAHENGFAYTRANWLFEITMAQVRAFEPEVLFVSDYTTFSASYLRHLKSECRSIKLVFGWCGAPYSDASVFKEYDIVLSNVPELVSGFVAQGHRCYQINHAFEPRVLKRMRAVESADVDFSFIGSISKNRHSHHGREELLLSLLERTNLQVFTDVYQPALGDRLSVRARRLAYDAARTASSLGVPRNILSSLPLLRRATAWDVRPSLPEPIDGRIARRARPPLFGLAMYQALQQTRISLNTHIDLSSSHASNMRLYEATGVGTCLLTDWRPNLSTLFEPDSEVVSYRSIDECVEKVNYLMEHEKKRRAIASAGQQRTLRDHSFDSRAGQLDDLIRSALMA